MIEFVIGIDRGRGGVGYLAKREEDGSVWITHERKGALAFPNLEAAKAEAHRYIQEHLDNDGLFSPGHQALAFKIETRLNKTTAADAQGTLTDEEAQGLLDVLKGHFKEPVLPMSHFCEAITTWFRCIEEANAAEDAEDNTQGHGYHSRLRDIERDIHKSALLARLLYGGEKLRTRKCPIHKGHWRGLESPGNRCPMGCGLSGWLPESAPELRPVAECDHPPDQTHEQRFGNTVMSRTCIICGKDLLESV